MSTRGRSSASRALLVAASVLLSIAAGVWWLAFGAFEAPHRVPLSRGAPADVGDAQVDDGARDEEPAHEGSAREALIAPPVLAPAGARVVRGRVVERDGSPAAGAALWIEAQGAQPGTVDALDVSSADGAFRLETNSMAGTLCACGVASGELTRAFALEHGSGELDLGVLRLPRGATIRGRVLDFAGRGKRGVEVQAWARDGGVWSTTTKRGHPMTVGFRRAFTQDDGTFELAGLRACLHDVVAGPHPRAPCIDAPRRELVLPDADEVVFESRSDARVKARVVDARTQEPLASFVIGGEPLASPDGSFDALVCFEAGLALGASGYAGRMLDAAALRALVDAGNGVVALEPLAPAPSGTLRVVVTDPSGDPVPMPIVRFVPYSYSQPEQSSAGPGCVLATGIVPGVRSFYVDAPGWSLVKTDQRIENGRERAVDVVLERGQRVRVRVLDALGLCARGYRFEVDGQKRKERDCAWVYAPGTGANSGVTRRWRSNSAQRLRLDPADGWIAGLPAGKYTLIVYVDADDVREHAFEVDADEERTLEIACPALNAPPRR